MAIQTRGRRKIDVGDRVRSIAVGQRQAFDGEVIERRGAALIVKDAEGRGWHRWPRELQKLSSAVPTNS